MAREAVKRALNKEEAKALYCLNKYAKQERDDIRAVRDAVKKVLFDNEKGDSECIRNLSDNAKNILKRYGIEKLGWFEDPTIFSCSFCELTVQDIKDLTKPWLYPDDDLQWEIETASHDYPELGELFGQYGDDIIYSPEKWNLVSKEAAARLDYLAKGWDDWQATLNEALGRIEDWHLFLHDDSVYDLKNNLYDLKTMALVNSGYEPIAFHELDSSYSTLAYFEIEGYKFHCIALPFEYEEDEVDSSVSIGAISSELKVDEPYTLKESVEILFAFLDLDEELIPDFLAGKKLSCIEHYEINYCRSYNDGTYAGDDYGNDECWDNEYSDDEYWDDEYSDDDE